MAIGTEVELPAALQAAGGQGACPNPQCPIEALLSGARSRAGDVTAPIHSETGLWKNAVYPPTRHCQGSPDPTEHLLLCLTPQRTDDMNHLDLVS